MADDEFGDDAALSAAFEKVERTTTTNTRSRPEPPRVRQDPRPPNASQSAGGNSAKIQQPTPQPRPNRFGPNSILVSPRQKGNPILNGIKTVPWEYSDMVPDYVMGATTCALFLSLKYHRLHPEYIYNRIQKLGGKYNLRVLLTMVDISNHEESLKELSKTSIINNVTIILCWSAQEAGHYLELYKTYEFAAPTGIKAVQSTNYSDRMIDFITEPRGINKTDAISLVSNFGSIRTAINARPEEISLIAGWGEKKVQRWCNTVREPFRVKKAAKRGVVREDSQVIPSLSRAAPRAEEAQDPRIAARLGIGATVDVRDPKSVPGGGVDAERRPGARSADTVPSWEPGADEEEAMLQAQMEETQLGQDPAKSSEPGPKKRKTPDEDVSEGVMAALSRLRKQ